MMKANPDKSDTMHPHKEHGKAHGKEHAAEQAKEQPAQEAAAVPGKDQPSAKSEVAAPIGDQIATPAKLAEEAEAFCADLERLFRRAFGDLPKASDIGELRAQQAGVRDMVQRASALGGEAGAQLAAMTAERDKLNEAVLRARADFLNYQARTSKDLERAEEQALRRYMLDMLPVLDSVLLSMKDAQSAASPDALRLRDAIGLIYNSLCQTLAVRGLQRIVAEAGKPFDPSLHEAVAQRPSDPAKGEKPNMVLEELRAGYLWKGLLLRPVQVLVTEPDKQAKKAEPGKGKDAPAGT